jgi:hypothetical protein
VSTHVGNFEAIVESKIRLRQGQSQDTLEAAKKGYEQITGKIDKQSIEVAKVLTNASDSFDRVKQEMEAIKIASKAELQAMQTAIKKMEADIRDNAGDAGGNWPVGNGHIKSAMEHRAISNLKILGNDRQGYSQWHDKFVNAMAQVHREYRTVLQLVAKAFEREEKLPTGDIDDWEEWVDDREIVTIDLKRLNEDLFAVLLDITESQVSGAGQWH